MKPQRASRPLQERPPSHRRQLHPAPQGRRRCKICDAETRPRYRAANREKIRARDRRHIHSSPERRRKMALNVARKRAIKIGASVSPLSPDLEERRLIEQDGDCYLCGAFIADGWYE